MARAERLLHSHKKSCSSCVKSSAGTSARTACGASGCLSNTSVISFTKSNSPIKPSSRRLLQFFKRRPSMLSVVLLQSSAQSPHPFVDQVRRRIGKVEPQRILSASANVKFFTGDERYAVLERDFQ